MQNLNLAPDLLNHKLRVVAGEKWGAGSNVCFLPLGDSDVDASLRITYFDFHFKQKGLNHRVHCLVL